MSITRIKKGQIIDYMLEQILTSKNVINKVSENFNLSKTTIYRYLRELEEKYGCIRLPRCLTMPLSIQNPRK